MLFGSDHCLEVLILAVKASTNDVSAMQAKSWRSLFEHKVSSLCTMAKADLAVVSLKTKRCLLAC